MLADVRSENLTANIAKWEIDYKIKATHIVGELSLDAGAIALIDHAMKTFGRIDILVNNAGGGILRPFLQHTAETLEEALRGNDINFSLS